MTKNEPHTPLFQPEQCPAPLSVLSAGHQQCAPGERWGPGIRDHYLLHHFLAGRGRLVVGREQHDLEAGDTFLAYPNTPVLYTADDKEPWDYVWVGFHGAEAHQLVAQTDFDPSSPVLSGFCPQEVSRLVLELYSEYGTAPWSRPASTGRLYLLLALLIARAEHRERGAPSPFDCAETVAGYITSHYEQAITVAQLADFLSVSQSSLYRSFEARFHRSPKQFIMEYRIEKACLLLASSDYSVREIAASVGFEDPLYFSRAFKRLKGVSPRAYAEEQRELSGIL